jgi:very-short-patch-repair endonuclease
MGGKRKTIEDYHALANERGFRWLGDEFPRNTQTKTLWQCSHGHKWLTSFAAIQGGNGCPFCAGNAPKTMEDYYVLALRRGFFWIGAELPPNVQAHTRWRCAQGHEWSAAFAFIQQGDGCPFCAGNARKTVEDYCMLAKERGFRWLGRELPQNIKAKSHWRCSEGHQWLARYNDIQQGYGCPFCAGVARKTTQDYHILAEERGFRWLGDDLPTNTMTPTLWQCSEGHQWLAVYNNVKHSKSGCPYCYGNVRKTEEDYHAIAKERGLLWIGDEVPPNNHTYTLWQCGEGHQWSIPYHNIQAGDGCPFCAGTIPKTEADYHALARERDFIWIGSELPPNVLTRTMWECSHGHRWRTVYASIQQGRGCPLCQDMVNGARVSQRQRDLCHMLGGKLNHPCGPYTIDVALDRGDVSIAIEYDAWFWHGDKENSDSKRDQDLIVAGWRILRVRSNDQLPAAQQLEAAIARLIAGETYAEIVLSDWGDGPTFAEVLARAEVDSDWTQLDMWNIFQEQDCAG